MDVRGADVGGADTLAGAESAGETGAGVWYAENAAAGPREEDESSAALVGAALAGAALAGAVVAQVRLSLDSPAEFPVDI